MSSFNGNGQLTNRELARIDPEFRRACEAAGVYPSRQQYRKWKYRRGAAYQAVNGPRRPAEADQR